MGADLFDDVHIEPTSGCWLWGGRLSPDGTPVHWSNGKKATVARTLYKQRHDVPDGKMILNQCGCRGCVNPDHTAYVATWKTKAERQKKWESKNREHRARYLKQYAVANAERLKASNEQRSGAQWKRIIRAVVVCARDTLIGEAPVGLVPDQWVAGMLGMTQGAVAAYRTRYRIPASSVIVWRDCCECGERFTYNTNGGGNTFNRCDICRPRTRKIGLSTRNSVAKRDGGVCRYCSTDVGVDFEVDHIVPWSIGGWDSVVNYALSCRACNQAKGANRLPVDVEWRMIHDNLERRAKRGRQCSV